MIQIILESFSSLFKGIEIFLQSKDLTLGAILALVAPFVALWIKISNEKGKKAKAKLVERRQMQIAFNINEVMEKLGVESKWSLQEIGSTHEDPQSSKKSLLLSRVVTILRRKKNMDKLKSRKLWMGIFGALLPIINEEFNLGLNTDTVIASVGAIIAYIIGQAHVDSKKVGADNAKLPMDTESSI
jgi:hypothetical protein